MNIKKIIRDVLGIQDATPPPLQAGAKVITERELGARFRAAPGSPLFEAVIAVIEEHMLQEMGEALMQESPDRDQRWHLGGAAALERLRDNLREREATAREEEETPEKG